MNKFAVIETVRGVVLELEPGAPAEAVVARMRCHLEYSRARGFPEEEREDCPLFLSGSTLSLEGNAVEISAANPITAAAIRRDARRLFGH